MWRLAQWLPSRQRRRHQLSLPRRLPRLHSIWMASPRRAHGQAAPCSTCCCLAVPCLVTLVPPPRPGRKTRPQILAPRRRRLSARQIPRWLWSNLHTRAAVSICDAAWLRDVRGSSRLASCSCIVVTMWMGLSGCGDVFCCQRRAILFVGQRAVTAARAPGAAACTPHCCRGCCCRALEIQFGLPSGYRPAATALHSAPAQLS